MGWPSAARARSKNQRLRLARRKALVPTTRTLSAHRAQPLPKALEAAQCTFGRSVVQPPAVAHARGQTHHFAQAVQNDQLAVRMTGHDHMKTIGAQIDSDEHVGYDTTAAHLHGHT